MTILEQGIQAKKMSIIMKGNNLQKDPRGTDLPFH